ncbi:MAG: hypothetical protein ACJ8AI_19790 [Rhodopila sp.]
MHRIILATIAIVAIGAGHAPALARGGGGGGHGGSGGHGGFAGRGGFSGHGGFFSAPGHPGVRGRGFALGAPGLIVPRRFVPPIIRPEVIAVPPMPARPVVSGAIVPPLTAPIVPPFGPAAANPSPDGLPVVVTPFVDTPAFGPGFVARAPARPGASRAQAAWPGAVSRGGVSTAASSNGLPAACHPMPNGYHCDWPS